MSSFSDKLAMFQNSSNKINYLSKKSENIPKNKVKENQIFKLNIDNKGKEKENVKNKDTKPSNNSSKRNSVPISNKLVNNINDKIKSENNKIVTNNKNDLKNTFINSENKGNNIIKRNSLNQGKLKDMKENNSNNNNTDKQNTNQLIKKDQLNRQTLTTEKKDKNLNNNNNQNSQTNSLKHKLNIFESKIKSNEKKENLKIEQKVIKNNEKELKENIKKINIDKINLKVTNNSQNNNSKEVPIKNNNTDNKTLNKVNNGDNKSNFKNIINQINNNINQKNNTNDLSARKSEIIRHKTIDIKNVQEEQNTNKSNNKISEEKKENVNNKTSTKININNNKTILSRNKINKNDGLYSEKNKTDIKNNNEKILKTEPIKALKTNSGIKSVFTSKLSEENNENIIEKKLISESVMNDTFCIAFFIASFNFKDLKMIEKSNELMADCGHTFCSSLPAIVPQIFARYPEKDTKDFEISDLAASICFPNGIKICFDKNETHVNGLKNYSSILTNEVGNRYFISTYHLYFKYTYEEFIKECDYVNSIDKTLLEAEHVKYIYIPLCICLLSKYPFFNQMEKGLECLRFSLYNHNINPNEIYDLIIYLIKSIPVPPLGTKLNFPLPYYPDLISINQPKYKDIFLFGDNPSIILEYLSVEEILIIFRLLLFEQKVLLVGNNYDTISQIAYNFTVLLYPFQWVHTFIPIMTEQMMKYLESFLPFFNGMHISLYELASGFFENVKENIFIFDFNKHNFEMNTFPSLNSKNIIKKINELIPPFPKNIFNNLNFGLGVIKAYIDKSKTTKNINGNNSEENFGINIKIKQIIIQTFIEILYDYKTYLSLVNNIPVFNTKAMLKKKPKADIKFYKELTQTQLFQVFLQNNPVNKKMDTFFEEQSEIYEKLKDKKDFKDEFINNYNITCEINENYIIPLDILDNFDIKNPKKIKFQGPFKQNEYRKFVKKKYFIYETHFKPKSILKYNKIIINDRLNFDKSNFPSDINFYIIPNAKFNFEREKQRKTIMKNNLRKISEEEELTPQEKDDIRENISDVITKIFKNEPIANPEEDEKLILDSINNNYGRDLYTTSLYSNKNILHKESFEFLEKLICSTMNKILSDKITQEKKIFYSARLFKCCDNFTKDEKSLASIIYPKLDKIHIINETNFWREYAKLYLDDKFDKNLNNDDHWVNCLKQMKNLLLILKLKNSVIYSILAELGKNIVKENKFSRLMKDIISSLRIYEV